MRDFIGNTFVPGAWIATTGAGNSTAEYGMILAKVASTEPFQIKRIVVTYSKRKPVALVRTSSIRNPNKWCVVRPSGPAQLLFERVEAGKASPEDVEKAARWLEGKHGDLF